MFFKKKEQYTINQADRSLKEQLNTLLVGKHQLKGVFGEQITYLGKWEFDEWMLERDGLSMNKIQVSPDVHIVLTSENAMNCLVNIRYYYSPIWKLFWVFFNVCVFAGCLFIPHIKVFSFIVSSELFSRCVCFVSLMILFNGINYLSFLVQTARLSKHVKQIIESVN